MFAINPNDTLCRTHRFRLERDSKPHTIEVQEVIAPADAPLFIAYTPDALGIIPKDSASRTEGKTLEEAVNGLLALIERRAPVDLPD